MRAAAESAQIYGGSCTFALRIICFCVKIRLSNPIINKKRLRIACLRLFFCVGNLTEITSKNFFKNFQKPLDKANPVWYNIIRRQEKPKADNTEA